MANLYRWLYSLLLYLLIPLEIIRLLLRSRKAPAYRARWSERFALKLPRASRSLIWFHTVSVGETLAAIPVIRDTLRNFPEREVLVTTMTPTGSERVQTILGDEVIHCYAPYDLPHAMAHFIKHFKPHCCCVMETELWPNMIHQLAINNVPTILMNARLSEKSATGYRRFETLTHDMLSKLTMIAAQNATDAKRFESLGAQSQQLQVTGNIKFDLTIPDDLEEQKQPLLKSLAGRPVWLAASTHLGEDEIILKAHHELLQSYPNACLILVPRHPERFESVYQLCRSTGLEVGRRSLSEQPSGAIFVADTMGELLLFVAVSDMAFVGGSLVNTGGHNCLEVSAFSKPVISGPHDFNFAEINKSLYQKGGLAYVSDAETLAKQLITWLQHPQQAKLAGESGYQVVEANRGALGKLLTLLAQYIS